MKDYLKLFRIKQYIKNFLIFIPCFFAKNIFKLNNNEQIKLLFGFIIFCLTSSIVYIINDIIDLEEDKNNKIKKDRPLASGKISLKNAYISIILLTLLNIFINILLNNYKIACLIITYFILNIFYSKVLKNIPIIDIYCLSLFYIIRIFYG